MPRSGVYDYEELQRRIWELGIEPIYGGTGEAPKPKCPRFDGALCSKPCKEYRRCYVDYQRENGRLPGQS